MVSRKLLALGILLILGGVLLSGCLCCCSTPDSGVYAPPAIPKIRNTATPIVKQNVTVQPVVVPVTVVPSPTIVVTTLPNTT